jgi:trans-aconitate 2-methyltransferase
MDAKAYYDEFVGRQTAVGVNARHHSILARLLRAGMRPGDTVLEIGCGVGTLTELLADTLDGTGSLLAVDLSPASVEEAGYRLGERPNVRLLAADIVHLDLEGEFDVVVLPDVIEHIPLGRHDALFARVAGLVKPGGFVLAHYPNPHYLRWCQEHRPEVLQVIDQPIEADELLAHACPHGLYLESLETYSIWVRECDYVAAVLRPRAGVGEFADLPPRKPSLATRVRARARRLLR